MTHKELKKQCRCYKGEEYNPFNGTGSAKEFFWDVEKDWVESEGKFCGSGFGDDFKICEEWEYYNDYNGKKYPDIEPSLLSHFCHHWFWQCYYFPDSMDSFYGKMQEYLTL